jgi:iron complex transport system ATP-binding protein
MNTDHEGGFVDTGGEALHLRDVSFQYAPHGKYEVCNVDLTLSKGELVCLLGPNGAGKSTVLRIASGIFHPSVGDVKLFGRDLRKLSRGEIARTLAVVEQHLELATGFTVREVVAMGRAPYQDGWMTLGEHDKTLVERALERCDLGALAARPAHALSGGEQKRVALARALVQEPRVLLLDEPGAFLDIRHQLDLYELLVAEVKQRQLACLVVMHDLNVAAQFADRIVLMKGGRRMASGTPRETMTPETLQATFDIALYTGINESTGARFFLPTRKAK